MQAGRLATAEVVHAYDLCAFIKTKIEYRRLLISAKMNSLELLHSSACEAVSSLQVRLTTFLSCTATHWEMLQK
jgi:hypothetical protein